jgi:hypothetical protein
MATQDRSMQAEFSQGIVDNSYIQLAPNRGGQIENYPIDRLSWPTYRQAELHKDDSMIEAMLTHLARPVERLTAHPGDPAAL